MANSSRFPQDLALLVLRLALGGTFLYHGVHKFLQPGGADAFVQAVEGLKLPFVPASIAAYAALTAEIGGGALVVLGILPRLGALAVAAVMVVAIVKVHSPNGFALVGVATQAEIEKWALIEAAAGSPAVRIIPHGCELAVALLAMALAILLAGGGAFSPFHRRREAPPA